MAQLDPNLFKTLQFKRSRRFDPSKEFGENLPDNAGGRSANNPPGTGYADDGTVIFPKSQREIEEEKLRKKVEEIRRANNMPSSGEPM